VAIEFKRSERKGGEPVVSRPRKGKKKTSEKRKAEKQGRLSDSKRSMGHLYASKGRGQKNETKNDRPGGEETVRSRKSRLEKSEGWD